MIRFSEITYNFPKPFQCFQHRGKKSEKYDDKIRKKNMKKKSMFDRFDLEIDPKGQIPML